MITRFRGLLPRLNSKGRYAAEECGMHATRRKNVECTLRGGRMWNARHAAEECGMHDTRRKNVECTLRGGRMWIARYAAEECGLHDTLWFCVVLKEAHPNDFLNRYNRGQIMTILQVATTRI